MVSLFVGTALNADLVGDKTPTHEDEIPTTNVNITNLPTPAATSSVINNFEHENMEEEDSGINQTENVEDLSVESNKKEELSFHISSVADPSDLPAEENSSEQAHDRVMRSFRPLEEEQAQPTRTAINGWTQLGALTEKNIRIKLRSPFSTLLELLLPLVFSSIFILSYRLSTNLTDYAREYSSIALNIPGIYLKAAVDALKKQGKLRRTRNRILNTELGMGPIRADTFLGTTPSQLSKTDSDLTTKAKQLSEAVYDLLTHPLPIPTLTQYVTLATAVKYGTKDLRSSKLYSIMEQSSYGATLYNLINLGTLHLSPEGPAVTNFLQFINDTYPSVFNPIPFIQNLTNSTSPLLQIRTHKSSDDAVSYIRSSIDAEPTWALIDMSKAFPLLSAAAAAEASKFNISNTTLEPLNLTLADLENVTFTIRMNSTSIPKTSERSYFFNPILNTKYQMYYLSGFLTLQKTLEEFTFSQASSVISATVNSSSFDLTSCQLPNSLRWWSMPMPTPEYNVNLFFASNAHLMALMITMGFLYPMSRLVKSIVEEKELRIKETLFILGVKPWAYNSSLIIVAYMVFLLASVILSLTIHYSILVFSSLGYLFALVVLFGSATVGFSFFITSFFSKSKIASLVGPMALFATIFPYFLFLTSNQNEYTLAKMLSSLLPCTAFSLGFKILTTFELGEVGVHSWNASQGSYSFNTSLAFLAFDTIFYIVLAWYFNQVIPSQFGARQPFYFCLKPSYWGYKKKKTPSVDVDVDVDATVPNGNLSNGNFEVIEQSKYGQPKVVIKNLVKQYAKNGPKVVDHLNLDLYENQITCLLGHNGAGKTTAISILTGLIPPTHGECTIYGESVSTELDEARQSMGICPQHDVLFRDLTVAEHLKLFDRIKGVSVTADSMQKRAEDFGLGGVIHALPCQLSGGMKRKLSIAIAFCGDSKFILLDEPTTGMDPYARRSTWEMLRKSKTGRVILLTTHFMDEAEILSDRIAVMKSGQLQCFGSPLFLKKAFGLGYTLTVVLSESPCNSDYTLGCGVENPANNLKQNGPDQAMNSTLTFSSEKKQRELKHHQCEEIQQNREVISTHGAEMVSRSSHYVSLTDGAPPGSKMERIDTSKITPNDLDSVSGLSVNMELETNGEQMLNRPMMKAAKSIEVSYGFSDGDDAPVASFLALQGISETDVKKTRVAISDHSTVLSWTGHRCNSSVSSSGNVQSPDELELEKGLGGQFMLNQADLKINARNDILGLLQQFIPETQLLRYSGREVMFRIPNGKENMFPELFDFFDNAIKCCRIHIGGYGISSSSLEEIFLLLAEDSTIRPFTNEAQVNIKNPMLLTKAAFSEDETRSNFSVVSKSMMKDDWETVDVGFFGQLSVLLRKRFSIQRRDFKGFFSIILVPFLAISVVLLVLTVDLGSSGPPIQISLELYKNLPLAGENKTCSVLLGNGSSLLNNDATMLELKDFLQLNSHYVDAYEAHDVSSSKVMSSYLLNTTSSSTKAARLGSYVVGDRINVHVDMNWNQFWKLSEEANVMSYVNNTQWSSWLSSKPNGRSLSKLKIIEPYWKSQRFDSERFDPTALPVIAVLAKELLNNLQENGIEVLQLTNNLNPNGMSLTFPGTYHMIRNWPNGKAKYRLSVNTSVTILHNITSPHGVAIFNHEYANSRYKQCTGNGSINIVNHPLPISTKKSVEIRSMLSIFAVLSTLIPLCFVPSAIIVFAVKEKGCKSKHVQLVSGVRLSSYWISCYIWDLAIYSVLVALIMCVLALYGPNSAQVFMGDTASVFATALLFLGYGVSALPFAYLISRSYESSSDAQISVLCWFFITGFMALATYGILLTMGSTTHIAVALKPLFRFFPAFNVGDGLLNLCLSFFERQIFSTDSLPLDWSVAGGPAFFLFILSIPYMCLLLILECSETSGSGGNFGHILRKTRRLMNDGILKYSGVRQNSDGEIMFQDTEDVEDEDVTIMKNQVLTNIEVTKSSAKVLMINLWKIYPKWSSVFYKCLGGEIWCACFKRCGYETSRDRNYSISDVSKLAVRGLTLAIEKGETFGLLGANGAGKSTTMAILTGDTAASSGDAFVSGYDVTGCTAAGVSKARKRIGFCPQVDPLLDLLTGRETLTMFGLLRGIPWNNLDAAVDNLLSALTLSKHADKTAGTYSGGNRRKLSLGVALIGNPDVIFIDESSSGMDPYARRKVWDLISEVAKTRMVVLTTHSMEEAEALCTRLTIMVDGKMKCIGSVQHLKSKYLGGYSIDLQLESGASSEILEAVKRHIREIALPSAVLAEEHGAFMRFAIPRLRKQGESLSLGSIFASLEAMRRDESMLIQDYSVSQSTLEQVFINLTKDG